MINYDSMEKRTSVRFKVAVGAIVTLAVVAATLMALYVHEALDNNSTLIIGQLENALALKVTIIPKKSTIDTRTYTGYIVSSRNEEGLQLDGTISYVQDSRMYNYTLVQNQAYYTISNNLNGKILQNSCLAKDQIPPLYTLEKALKEAKVVERMEVCENGKWIEVVFAGEGFVFCSTESKLLESVVGEDLDMVVEYLSSKDVEDYRLNILPPVEDCPRIDIKQSEEKLHTRWLRNVKEYANHAIGNRRLSEVKEEECVCRSEKRECVFIHGIGNDANPAYVSETSKEKWGDIHEKAPCCSSTKFLHLDTSNNAWNTKKLSELVCSYTMSEDFKIHNKIIVTHSMGNNILAHALENEYCTMGEFTDWVALVAPMRGSQSTNTLKNNCRNDSSDSWNGLSDWALKVAGKCPMDIAHQQMYYENTQDASPKLNHDYKVARNAYAKYATAVLCGTSPTGLATHHSISLQVVSSMTDHNSPDDGVVEYDSCTADLPHAFEPTHQAKFFKAGLNHMDATFRNGDGWWGVDRKPIKWFQCLL